MKTCFPCAKLCLPLLLLLGSLAGGLGLIPRLALAAAPLSDQSAPPPSEHSHFGHLSIDQGLSQSSVTAIVQDKQGFLWFGTEDGLNRYDGVKFQIFRPAEGDPASLSDIWINALALDAEGALWAGTRQGGVNRYEAATGTFVRYEHAENLADSLSHNNVRAIYADAQGRLWFGTEAGLDLLDQARGTFAHFKPAGLDIWMVQTIAQAADGNLWLGTSQGLWKFDPAAQAFSTFPLGGEPRNIFGILVEPNASLWVAGTGIGLVHFFPETGALRAYLPPDGLSTINTRQLVRAASGQLWIGSGYGVNLFDPGTGKFMSFTKNPNNPASLSENFIQSLYRDASGIVWIGTYGGGLSYYDPQANNFTHYWHDPDNATSLASNLVFAIAPAPDGTVWLAAYSGGLDQFDPRTGTFTHYAPDPAHPDSLSNAYLRSILVARDGKVWVGSDGGLDIFDPVTGKFAHVAGDAKAGTALPGTQVAVILQDSRGTIWVGTNQGLARYNAADQTFTPYAETRDATGLNDGVVTALYEDHTGALWVGTFSGGASRLDLQTSTFTHYTYRSGTPNTLGNNTVLAFYESPAGDLWVGTGGGGLSLFEPGTGTFKTYDAADGLPNNVIYGILPDEAGHLWLSTNFGVASFDPGTGTSRNFTAADGLQSNEFNAGAYARDADGRLYFGGVNGLSVFRPAEVTDNSFIPPVRLVALTQDGAPLAGGQASAALDRLELRYPRNSFEFEVAALSYSQANQNTYAYKLEGYDKDWYYAGTDRAGRYVNLPGGDYTLRLKAANSDGVWNEQGLALRVRVIPPFWQTGWFYGLVGLGLAAGGWGVYRLRIHTIERQKRELERQVSERTKEIEHLFEQTKQVAILEERNRLARDLHDSAKQKAFAALAQLGAARSLAPSRPEKAARHLQEAETLVGDVIQEIAFLIQEIHPAALKENGLAAALREYVFEWGNRTGIDVDLQIADEIRLTLEIEQTLYRSIQEALANVARHSEATSVKLALTLQPAGVTLHLADNGKGFDLRTTPNGMGLRSIRERVAGVGGACEIGSLPGQGTWLDIHIPLEADHA